MSKVAAVLTGDLVQSGKAGALVVDKAMMRLSVAAAAITCWAGAETRFTRFRGDGWQIYIDIPGLVLRSTLLLTASLRADGLGIATRISAAVEEVRHVGDENLSDADGEAFVVSGREMDAMPRTRRVALSGRRYVPEWQSAVFEMIDWQSNRWSVPQAEAMVLALEPEAESRAEIANRLGITRQALQARLQGAGFDALTSILHAFERYEYDRLTE